MLLNMEGEERGEERESLKSRRSYILFVYTVVHSLHSSSKWVATFPSALLSPQRGCEPRPAHLLAAGSVPTQRIVPEDGQQRDPLPRGPRGGKTASIVQWLHGGNGHILEQMWL